ncbi:S1 RNA-binding domain-containing protein, partial [Klebsiella pneumoniae]|nr:S1 RNA-binding domain-containing protein [Klebsiella pneumoniae]
ERRAVDAEREVEKLKMIEYISEHIGEEFEGIISGFSNLIIFVELPSTIEGTVRIAEMTDDYYSYHEENMTMVGERTGKVYSLGDTVNVKVVYAD